MLSQLVLESQKVICAFVVFRVLGNVFVSQFSIAEKSHNKQFKQIRNAWQFWFAVSFVFTAQCGGFCIALLTT
ncbi:TPA: DUF3265 domain-containing protein [Vibrio parahaemolyticus]|nr:DUF3265 domain-containing protein [Vibrio parahaemolyticus]